MYPTATDLALAAWFHAHAIPALTRAMLLITDMNSNLAVNLMAAALALILLKERQRDWLVTLILAVPAGLAINVLLKHLFAFPRPSFDHPLLKLETYSFPSGHVAGATLFYGFVAAYFWQRTADPRLRAVYVAVAAMLVVLVAFTRVYLGVHYLTDVIGGALWSSAWLAFCLWLRKRLSAR
jgi:membrane-associated phospholipid phosphatase